MAAAGNPSDSAVVSIVQANTRPAMTAMIAVIASRRLSCSRTAAEVTRRTTQV